MPSGSGTSTTKTRVKVLSREVKLTYLQSQQVRVGLRDAGEIAGEGGGVGTVNSGTSKPGSPGFLGIGGSAPSSFSSQASDTGWIISRTWDETSFNVIRYGIGIRDIGVFNYQFASVSELVTRPWKSPKPIYKVQLETVEQIPSIYPVGPEYIEYYVSHNGNEWHRLIPLSHPTKVDSEGNILPKTLTFNPDVGGEAPELVKFVTTDEPVLQVRLRIILKAAAVDNADRYSPILKSYRLKIYPLGGLRE